MQDLAERVRQLISVRARPTLAEESRESVIRTARLPRVMGIESIRAVFGAYETGWYREIFRPGGIASGTFFRRALNERTMHYGIYQHDYRRMDG